MLCPRAFAPTRFAGRDSPGCAAGRKARGGPSAEREVRRGGYAACSPRGVEGRFACPGRMNTIPHSRETRKVFYDDVRACLKKVIMEGELKRMRVFQQIPELNTETDVYRIGTLLELAREMAGGAAEDGKRVKICVQGSLGKGVFQGMPLQIAGARFILDNMDWGEDLEPFISTGAIGAEEVTSDSDVYILIAPQNMVGASILPKLEAMCDAAGDKPVVMLNANLTDIPGAGGLMQVRGRDKRLEFAAHFQEIYHLRMLYRKPYFHPIFGLLRMSHGGPWEVYKRVVKKTEAGDKVEKYCLSAEYDTQPKPAQITLDIARQITF